MEHNQVGMIGVNETPISQVTFQNQQLKAALQSKGTQTVEKLFKSAKAQAGLTYIDVSQVFLFRMNKGLDMLEVVAQVSSIPGVIYAEPNYRVISQTLPPNDPNFGFIPYSDPSFCEYQWGFCNDYPGEPGWDIDALQAWDIQTGNLSILLTIIDTDLEQEHCNDALNPRDEFFNRVAGRYPPGSTDDEDGHGTECAGIAAATTNSGPGDVGILDTILGVAGVAGGWYPEKEGPSLLIGIHNFMLAQTIDCIDWASSLGTSVISCSWSLLGEPISLTEAILNAFDAGATIFFATGNEGTTSNPAVRFPAKLAKYDICCAVGAMDRWGYRESYSCYGPEISFIAPSVSTFSTCTGTPSGSGNWYYIFGGTSAATPFAAGIAALLYSQAYEKGLDLLDVDCKRIMERSARHNNAVYGTNRPDIETGYGCVNAYNALVRLDEPYTLEHGTVNNPTPSIPPYGRVNMVFSSSVPAQEQLTGNMRMIPAGSYSCNRYTLSGTATFSSSYSELPWAWARILDGNPGFSAANPNAGVPWAGVSNITNANANFFTYAYWTVYTDIIVNSENETTYVFIPVYIPRNPFLSNNYSIAYTVNGSIAKESPPRLDVLESPVESSFHLTSILLPSDIIKVCYQIDQSKQGTMDLFDVTGRSVKSTLLNKETGTVLFDMSGLPRGCYFVRLSSGSLSRSAKVVLLP